MVTGDNNKFWNIIMHAYSDEEFLNIGELVEELEVDAVIKFVEDNFDEMGKWEE